MTTNLVRFSGFTLDFQRRVLERNGEIVPIRAKSFALLAFLAANSDRVISKDEILENVWGHMIVTDDALVQTIKDVRRSIDDLDARIVVNVPKRGYLFASERSSRSSIPRALMAEAYLAASIRFLDPTRGVRIPKP
jgi:DNA-binding winged helix-turn-helix (wHTH) protein